MWFCTLRRTEMEMKNKAIYYLIILNNLLHLQIQRLNILLILQDRIDVDGRTSLFPASASGKAAYDWSIGKTSLYVTDFFVQR